MNQLDFQVRIEFDNGEEEVNCFSTFEEADTVYTDRLKTEDQPCVIELISVLCQHRIEAGGWVEVDVLSEQMKNQ